MSRALRGALDRWAPLAGLAAVSAVVTGGTVTVLGFSEESGASPWLALPLLLIGLVSLPAVGRELALARRAEIAVARLRGMHGPRLGRLLLGEPLAALVAGLAVGLAVGLLLTWVLTGAWLGRAGLGLGRSTLLGAGAVLGGGVAGVAVGLAGAGREPLGDLLQPNLRPRPGGLAAIFFSILVIVGAVVSVYRSGKGDDPDMLVLAGPALVGLAAGQITLWLLALGAKTAARLSTRGGLPAYLASRRVARTSDSAGALRLLVAAGTLAVVALTAVVGALAWSQRSARVTAGAPTQVAFDDAQAVEVQRLTERADPEGKWLLTAVTVPGTVPRERRVYLDVDRLDAVVGGFLDGTLAADAVRRADELPRARPAPLVGTDASLTAEVRRVPPLDLPGADPPRGIDVTIDYATSAGQQRTAHLVARVGRRDPARPITAFAPVDCAEGCVVTRLTVTGGVFFRNSFIDVPGVTAVRLTGLSIDGADLLGLGWQPPPGDSGVAPGELAPSGDGLMVATDAGSGEAVAEAKEANAPLPVLASHVRFEEENRPAVDTPGGDDRPAQVLGEVPALPLVGTAGLMADLSTALYGASPTIPSAEVVVLARAGTPASVLAPLREAGGTVRDLRAVERAGEVAGGVVRTRAYALVSACCVLVAILALLGSTGRQRAAYQRDIAALRLLGVADDQIRSAGRRELVLMALVAVLSGVGGGLVASRLLLADLPLVETPPFSIPVEAADNLWPAAAVGALLGLLVVLAAGRARRVSSALTRPVTLREVAG